jgi:hypothetical protein
MYTINWHQTSTHRLNPVPSSFWILGVVESNFQVRFERKRARSAGADKWQIVALVTAHL